jgi:hypothetical protein
MTFNGDCILRPAKTQGAGIIADKVIRSMRQTV